MKIQNIFNKTIKILFFMVMLWIVSLLIIGKNFIDYPGKKVLLINNIVMVLIGIFFFFIISKKSNKIIKYDLIVKVLIPVFFLLQIFIFYNIYFETGWDPSVIMLSAKELVYETTAINLPYFSTYPNNILYTLILSLVLYINKFLGIFNFTYEIMSMVLINSFIASISSYLVYKNGKRLFNQKIAFIGYLLAILLFVFSGWNVICYSDSFAIFIPILIFDLYLSKVLKSEHKLIIISILSYFGFLIKPQTIIITIAIGIIELVKSFSGMTKQKISTVGFSIMITIWLLLGINYGLNSIYKHYGFIIDKEARLGYVHYLKMGVNETTNGGYYEDDVIFSMHQSNRKIRDQKNLIIFRQRIKKYGLWGYASFLSKKLLMTYDDGSFSWMDEGNFFAWLKPEVTKMSVSLRNIYYGENYQYLNLLIQFVWINIIMLIFINAIINILDKKKQIDYQYLIPLLTIMGLTMFELLFEARARYLYTNIPIFIIMAMYGINNITNILVKK